MFKLRANKQKETKIDHKEGDARKALLEELFYDFHQNRRQVYWVNFIRGIFFGFGSLLGGTIVVAIVFWVLAQVTGLLPAPVQDAVDGLSISVSGPQD